MPRFRGVFGYFLPGVTDAQSSGLASQKQDWTTVMPGGPLSSADRRMRRKIKKEADRRLVFAAQNGISLAWATSFMERAELAGRSGTGRDYLYWYAFVSAVETCPIQDATAVYLAAAKDAGQQYSNDFYMEAWAACWLLGERGVVASVPISAFSRRWYGEARESAGDQRASRFDDQTEQDELDQDLLDFLYGELGRRPLTAKELGSGVNEAAWFLSTVQRHVAAGDPYGWQYWIGMAHSAQTEPIPAARKVVALSILERAGDKGIDDVDNRAMHRCACWLICSVDGAADGIPYDQFCYRWEYEPGTWKGTP